MATLRSLNMTRMRDLVTCSVCLEVLEDPKALPCLHTYCSNCLEGMGCGRAQADITCPVCKDTARLPPGGVPSLPSDFKVEQMKDILEIGEDGRRGSLDAILCEVCRYSDRRPATLHCPTCAVFYCDRCIRKHAANALFRRHNVTKLTSASGACVVSALFCRRHAGHRVNFVCTTCRTDAALCAICFLDHDVTHDVSDVKDAAETFRKKFLADLTAVRAKMAALKQRKKDAEETRSVHEQMLQDTQEAICWQTLLIIAQLEDAKQKLISEAQDMFSALWSNCQEEEVDSHLNELSCVEKELEKIVDGSHENCLANHDKLNERVKTLQELAVPNGGTNKGVQFVPNKSPVNPDILGTLEYFIRTDFKLTKAERRDSIVKTERSEEVTVAPEIKNQKITIQKKDVEKKDFGAKEEEEVDHHHRCDSHCESCNAKSVLISFYSLKLGRLQKLCRHCRALTDKKPARKSGK